MSVQAGSKFITRWKFISLQVTLRSRWSSWLKLSYEHRIHILDLEREERWNDAEMAFLIFTHILSRYLVHQLERRWEVSLYQHSNVYS